MPDGGYPTSRVRRRARHRIPGVACALAVRDARSVRTVCVPMVSSCPIHRALSIDHPGAYRAFMASTNSRFSLFSSGSFLSIGSKNSFMSIGSVGSAFSIGSIGSFASVLSVASAVSAGAIMSWRSVAAVMDARRHGLRRSRQNQSTRRG